MTDNDNEPNEPEDEGESLDDVMGALEGAGYTEPEDDGEDADSDKKGLGGLPGPLAALEELTGTGKSLESYKDSPIASAVGPEGSQGALHVARGIDGLSPLGAMHPVMDIGIGFVLIQMEKRDANTEDGPDFAADTDGDEDGDVPDLGST